MIPEQYEYKLNSIWSKNNIKLERESFVNFHWKQTIQTLSFDEYHGLIRFFGQNLLQKLLSEESFNLHYEQCAYWQCSYSKYLKHSLRLDYKKIIKKISF